MLRSKGIAAVQKRVEIEDFVAVDATAPGRDRDAWRAGEVPATAHSAGLAGSGVDRAVLCNSAVPGIRRHLRRDEGVGAFRRGSARFGAAVFRRSGVGAVPRRS